MLITSNFIVRGIIPVNFPKSDSTAEISKEAINIDMTTEGVIFLKGEKVALSDLGIKLNAYDKNLQIMVSANKDMPIQPFVSIMDDLKKSGCTKISLQTEK